MSNSRLPGSRQMIAPGETACRPYGMQSIFQALVGTYAAIEHGRMVRFRDFRPRDTHGSHLGTRFDIAELIDRYNAGDRWFAVAEGVKR